MHETVHLSDFDQPLPSLLEQPLLDDFDAVGDVPPINVLRRRSVLHEG
jgi:hypothetical protein